MHKMLLDRDPVTGLDMASQPTLSRFENTAGSRQLYNMGAALAESVIERHATRLHHRARLVTIDLDPTDDPTHGAQQLSFFNSHYDKRVLSADDGLCYLQRRGGPVSVRRRVTSRQCDGVGGSGGYCSSVDGAGS